MNRFTIVPLQREYAEKIRQTRKDDYDHDVIESVATAGTLPGIVEAIRTGKG